MKPIYKILFIIMLVVCLFVFFFNSQERDNQNNDFSFNDEKGAYFNGLSVVENYSLFDPLNGSLKEDPWTYFEPLQDNLQINTDTYDSFGILVKYNSTTLFYFVREGKGHVHGPGKIVAWVYDIPKKSWISHLDVYDDGYDSRNVGGGMIEGKIYLFFGRVEASWDAFFEGMGYIYSKDGGNSWSEYNDIDLGWDEFFPYGSVVKSDVNELYYQPYYARTDGLYHLGLLQSVDEGLIWTDGPTIYEGEKSFSELSVVYLGEGKMIALIRDNTGEGNVVQQSISSDNGKKWSKIKNTNLGGEKGVKIPFVYYDEESDQLMALYLDRTTDNLPWSVLRFSKAEKESVFKDFESWGEPVVIDDIYPRKCCGYPSIVKISDNEYFFVHAKEMNEMDVDTWGGYLEI